MTLQEHYVAAATCNTQLVKRPFNATTKFLFIYISRNARARARALATS